MKGFSFLLKLQVPLFFDEEGMFQELVFIEVVMGHLISLDGVELRRYLATSKDCVLLPSWLSSKESACQWRRCQFSPWFWKIPWRRKWQITPVFLPGKSYGQTSLMGYSPVHGGHKRVIYNLATKKQQQRTVKRRHHWREVESYGQKFESQLSHLLAISL